jgi:hypothetical protein
MVTDKAIHILDKKQPEESDMPHIKKVDDLELGIFELVISLIPTLEQLCQEMITKGHNREYIEHIKAMYLKKWTSSIVEQSAPLKTLGASMNSYLDRTNRTTAE